MRAKISRKDFLSALSHSINIVDKKPAIPILSHVLLEFADNKIIFKSTDLDHSLVENVTAEIDTFGSTAVSAQMLYDVVRKLADNSVIELSILERGEKLQLKAGRSKFEIQTLPSADFPKIDLLDQNCDFEIATELLKELIDKTKFSMAIEETRYNLNGIYFHIDDSAEHIISAATDGHRLSVCKQPNCGCNGKIGILARKTILEVRKLLDNSDLEAVKIFKNENQVQFSIGSIILTARLVDAEFPNYTAVIPQKNENSYFVINREHFLEAIDRVSVISEDKTKSIKLLLKDETLFLSAINIISGGNSQDEVKVENKLSSEWEACFNARYLIDIANALDCEELKIYVKDRLSSILILPQEQESNDLFVVMPMRI